MKAAEEGRKPTGATASGNASTLAPTVVPAIKAAAPSTDPGACFDEIIFPVISSFSYFRELQ
jgi:hypothetical protein